jgi:hypothetical protein
VSVVSRRQFVQGASIAGLGLLAGGGRWPEQDQVPPKVQRVGVLQDPALAPYQES